MINKIKHEHISAYYYFEDGDESTDAALKEARAKFPKFIANRIMNEYKAVLKRLELSIDDGLPAPQFRFLCFLMMGKVIDKKDFVFAVEQYIRNKHS
jgi:hypothetical protein